MGIVQFLYHPDTVFTASDPKTVALELLSEIPVPEVEAAAFDSGTIRQTLLQAAVDQKSITAATDSTFGTYSNDYTLAQLHTIPAEKLENVVNDLLSQQATIILVSAPRSSVSTSSISTIMSRHTPTLVNSVIRSPVMAPPSTIATSLDSSYVGPNHSSSLPLLSVAMNQ